MMVSSKSNGEGMPRSEAEGATQSAIDFVELYGVVGEAFGQHSPTQTKQIESGAIEADVDVVACACVSCLPPFSGRYASRASSMAVDARCPRCHTRR